MGRHVNRRAEAAQCRAVTALDEALRYLLAAANQTRGLTYKVNDEVAGVELGQRMLGQLQLTDELLGRARDAITGARTDASMADVTEEDYDD